MLLCLLVMAVGLLVLPALLCLWMGGPLLLVGVLALVTWCQLGWWVAEDVLRYLKKGAGGVDGCDFDEYV